MLVWMGFVTYNSLVVVRLRGGTPTAAVITFAIGSLAYAVTASQSGRLVAAFDNRYALLTLANGSLGVGFATFLLAPSFLVAGLGILVLGAGFGVLLTLYRTIVTGLAGVNSRGGLVSTAEVFGRLVATATPVMMGAVIAVATPRVGLGPAIQAAGVGIAVVSSVGGVGCLYFVRETTVLEFDR